MGSEGEGDGDGEVPVGSVGRMQEKWPILRDCDTTAEKELTFESRVKPEVRPEYDRLLLSWKGEEGEAERVDAPGLQ